MKNKIISFAVMILISLFYISCNENKLDIDVSDVQVDLQINRYDIDMFDVNTNEFEYAIPDLQKKYGDFFDIYNNQIIGVGNPNQKEFLNKISDFYYYCDQIDLYNEVLKYFPQDDVWLNNVLTDAFKHYKYYFPNKNIPVVNTCISGFNLSVFTSDDFIGISLDKYLGSSYEGYVSMFENYLRRRMTKEMIPVDVMKAEALAEFPYNDSLNTLLTRMIYEGRVQYFLDAMLPNVEDTLKWGYTNSQMGWATEYEAKIWEYMISEDILFSGKPMDIKTYTGEAPFTTPFQNNSAPRAGSFVGYKIVQSYMKNNSDVTLKELMRITDYMNIYNNSFYKP